MIPAIILLYTAGAVITAWKLTPISDDGSVYDLIPLVFMLAVCLFLWIPIWIVDFFLRIYDKNL